MGIEGVFWVGGKKCGGKGQVVIWLMYDIVRVGYNIFNKQVVDSSVFISESVCNGVLCCKYKNGDEVVQVVVSVLGDCFICICKFGNECVSGGLENEFGIMMLGIGFMLMFDEIIQKNYEVLVELVNGLLLVNVVNLVKLKIGDFMVMCGVVQVLKDDLDNIVLV